MLRSVTGFDPLALPLLRTLAGDPISLCELARLSEQTGGLIYGTIADVPADLEGLDLHRILALDATSERTLIGLLGESSYVRVDARDVLASLDADIGIVIRDIALGLREYPDFPLLIEGETALLDALDEEARASVLTILLAGLKRRMLDNLDNLDNLDMADESGGDPLELEEHRRQAVRHLQWYVCREYARSGPGSLERCGLLDLPLFVDLDGAVWAMRQVAEALRAPEGLRVHYGHAFGGAELGSLSAAARAGRRPPVGRPSSLAVSVFCYRLLVALGRVRLAFDFDLEHASGNPASAATAFLVDEPFTSEWGSGVLGIPATRVSEPRIVLRTRERGVVGALDEVAHAYGVVGSIELSAARPDDAAIEQQLRQPAAALLERLITKLPEFTELDRAAGHSDKHQAALRVLLTYAGEQLSSIAHASGLAILVADPLAERILGLPLFDTGATTLVSGQRMIERFRRHFERGYFEARGESGSVAAIDWSQIVVASTPKLVLDWLDTHLQPAAVIMPASSTAERSVAADPSPTRSGTPCPVWDPKRPLTGDVLSWNLEHWLAQLRPDPRHVSADSPNSRCGPNTRVWVSLDELLTEGALMEGNDSRIDLWAGHPLAARAIRAPTPGNFAWLLLASYAHINAVAPLVTDAHEIKFHVSVGQALADGRLQVLAPDSADLLRRAG